MNPREENEPIVGRLYRMTDPIGLAWICKKQNDTWAGKTFPRTIVTQRAIMQQLKYVLLVKVDLVGFEIKGQFLLGEQVYDFCIILNTDEAIQDGWDRFFVWKEIDDKDNSK